MKISYNPKSSQAAITSQTAANDDIIFDLYASKLWAKGIRIGADWADISSKPSSLKNPYALTISLNGTSQGPYDGSVAKNINITPGSIGAATSGHTHDGRYLRWNGSTADISAMTWGTLTAANGYTILSHASSSDKGDMGFANKGGQIFMQLDGYYYQKEGQYRVLDTSDFTTFSNIGSQTTRITIGGITKDLKIDADLLDGWHLDSIRKNVGYSWSAKYRINNWSRIIKIDNYSNILLAINFAQNNQASNHLYLISTGYGCGNIVQLGANGYNGNSAIKIRLTENTATSHNVEIYSTYGYNGATELSINCNYTRIDGNSTITTYLTYTAGGGTVRKEITSSYSKIVANLQGNSDTTTKLQTPKQINGTNFDGSANITTSYWGATRTISLTGAVTGSVSTNGSGNITINTTYGTGNITNLDNRYVKKAGDTMQGNLAFASGKQTRWTAHGNSYITNGNADIGTSLGGDLANLVISSWNGVSFTTSCSGQTYTNKTAVGINCRTGIVYAANFVGNLEGNASTATALTTNAGNSINPIYFSGGKPVACTMSTGRGNGIVRSFSRGTYTSANQYFGNGTIVTIDPKGTGCISANDTILSLGDLANRNTQLLVAYDRDGVYYRRITDSLSYGDWKRLAFTTDNVASATKLQTTRTLWGNSFDGTKDINGSIVFPNIGDTATSNKISWSSSSDGADIYYQTTGTDQGNLVLNVKDDTNAYIQLALNGVFKSYFDVANSYWTGKSALADKWATARTFTIGNTAKNVDGSGNVSWSLSEIGVKDTWRTVQVNGTSIGNNTLNLCGSTYIGLTNVNGKVTFSLVGSGTTANQAILSNGTANGWTLKTLNIANWDAAYNFVSTITGTDTDKVINKWDEIVNFLAGITEDNKLNTLLNSKLSIQQLSAKDILTTKTNNALFWVNTKGTASSITTGPFTDHPYALLSVTNYNQNAENNKFFYRSRLAFSSAGDIKVASCHHENEYQQDETWYNVLTSKNSGIDGSTIKLNGTSITVYSSSTADGRYVKKSGDTMSGVLTIDTTNFGALIIKRNDDANGASIQFRGKSSIYGYIGLNNSTKDKQFLRWNSDTSKTYTILDTSSTYTSNGKGVINGTTITQVDNATNSTNSTNARKLVNWYSTRPTSLNTQFGDGSLRIFYATSSTTEGKPAEDSHILHLAWDNNGGWDTQLAVHTRSGKVSTRAQNSGTWQPWKTLAFTTDIPTSLPANGGNADTVDGYHASGLFTALSNSNRGISLTVGGTTKSLNNISVGDADTVDRYHANTIYNAPSFTVNNDYTSNTYILLATITISGTSLGCAEFTTLFQNRECLDSSSFILSGAIRRNSTTSVTATLSYITLHTQTPRNIYLRSDDGVTFLVYIQSTADSWTTYYRAIPIVDSGNITYSNTGTTSPISGSVLNITATKGGNVNYASSAGSANTATKLTSSAGNAALPIYFSDGKPVACTASSVFSNLSNSGNNLSITVAGQNRTLTVRYATSAGSATRVLVNQHTNDDINYPLVWSNQNNANNVTENQLFKSWQDLYYNPKNKRLFIKGSVNTANINATGTVTSAGFKHSGVTKNADQYVLTAGGGYTFLNQISNELAHEFSKDITVTSEWTDIEDFYGGNQNFLTQPGTYIVQVYYNDNSADGMYEGYFSGIMSWFTGTTNSNNADEIVLHRVGHAYANTIYLRTRESLESETNPYTKLQISANTTLKQHTYKFKFKRIC